MKCFSGTSTRCGSSFEVGIRISGLTHSAGLLFGNSSKNSRDSEAVPILTFARIPTQKQEETRLHPVTLQLPLRPFSARIRCARLHHRREIVSLVFRSKIQR